MLLVFATIAEREMGTRVTGKLLLLGAPVISLCLLLAVPDLLVYRGSSALSAMLGVVDGVLLWRKIPRLRAFLVALAAIGVAKTLSDAVGAAGTPTSLPDGVRVAWQAHVVGAAFAFAWVLLRPRPKSTHPARP